VSSKVIAISTSSFGKESSAPLDRLAAAGFTVRKNPHGRQLTGPEATEHLQGVTGVIAGTEKLTREILSGLPDLRVISRVGTGIDNVDLDAARELNIAVRNTPNAHVDAVAELTIAGILSLKRDLVRSHASIVGGGFQKPMGSLLQRTTIGFVGFGKVARAVARLLGPWNITVLAHDPVQVDEPGVRAEYVSLDELLTRSDIVSLHIPGGKANHRLIGAEQIARMRKDAMLVNTARGGLIDEAALLAHLREHPKASAFLDCFEQEPYKGELSKLENVLLTAHIGGYAREARVAMETEAVDNLLAVLGS